MAIPKRTLHTLSSAASRLLLIFMAAACLIVTIPHAEAITQAEINALKKQQQEISAQKAGLQTKLSSVQNDKAKAVQRKLLLEVFE